MKNFKLFLENEKIKQIPNSLEWIRTFFDKGISPSILVIWADQLEENENIELSEFFREIGTSWQDITKKSNRWRGRLVNYFYNSFRSCNSSFECNENLRGSWFIYLPRGDMRRHIINPGGTSYRLSLTTGKWFSYTNTGDDRVCVVSKRLVPTEESEHWYPRRRITISDFDLLDINQVPEDVLLYAFYKIIEKQVRGSH